MDGEEEVLISEAARELNRSHVTVWRHVQSGKLPARKVGPIYLIPRRALNEFKARERKAGRPRKAEPQPPSRPR
jgi:excisionase family DNA binding protein